MTDELTTEREVAIGKDLRDFGAEGKREPILYQDEPVFVRLATKGETCIGYRGAIPSRREYGFVQFCNSREHFHRNEAGYALSERSLRKIRSYGCKVILIAEDDTNMVWEFHESQFQDYVAKKNNPDHDKDPQLKVEILQNRGKWPDHVPYVLNGERSGN